MSEKDKMHTGELYDPNDPEIAAWQEKCLDRLYDYNHTRPTEGEKRRALLKEMFAEIGEGCYIEPPFHANFGGAHVHFGSHIYANFDLTLVDDTHIFVGDHTMFGPGVTVATAGHPILPRDPRLQGALRRKPLKSKALMFSCTHDTKTTAPAQCLNALKIC